MAKHPYGERREALCAWLTANGINPNHVPRDADLTIRTLPDRTRVLAYEAFDLTPDGHRQVDERGDKAAIKRVTTPLLVEPPDWWEPYAKPTRDDLLAVVERVEQLAERWKHVGDRKNGPRQELLQALGRESRPSTP
jgi:hypothetical protein